MSSVKDFGTQCISTSIVGRGEISVDQHFLALLQCVLPFDSHISFLSSKSFSSANAHEECIFGRNRKFDSETDRQTERQAERQGGTQ